VTIILAGYKDDIERKLFSYNIGMPSRFRNVEFDDLNSEELMHVWQSLCKKYKWQCAEVRFLFFF
jgi:hypothetical protein